MTENIDLSYCITLYLKKEIKKNGQRRALKVFGLLDPFWSKKFPEKKCKNQKVIFLVRKPNDHTNEEKNNFSNCFIFYCSFLTVWQNEFLIAQNEQFDWHVWFCSFYSFRKCHEKENRGKKSADFCSCCCQFYKCFWWLRLDQNVLSVCFASFFLVFTFLKHFFLRHEQPNYLQSGL